MFTHLQLFFFFLVRLFNVSSWDYKIWVHYCSPNAPYDTGLSWIHPLCHTGLCSLWPTLPIQTIVPDDTNACPRARHSTGWPYVNESMWHLPSYMSVPWLHALRLLSLIMVHLVRSDHPVLWICIPLMISGDDNSFTPIHTARQTDISSEKTARVLRCFCNEYLHVYVCMLAWVYVCIIPLSYEWFANVSPVPRWEKTSFLHVFCGYSTASFSVANITFRAVYLFPRCYDKPLQARALKNNRSGLGRWLSE